MNSCIKDTKLCCIYAIYTLFITYVMNPKLEKQHEQDVVIRY